MNKTHASLLLAALCTGLVVAGCQKPVTPVTTTTPKTATTPSEITIVQPDQKEVNGSISIMPATTGSVDGAVTVTEANTTTPAAADAAAKAVDDVKTP